MATVRRESSTTAIMDVERLRHYLAVVSPSRAHVVPEADGWSIFIPGLPITPPLGALPADLVLLLISGVGLDEAEVAMMAKEEAIARLQRYWTEGT